MQKRFWLSVVVIFIVSMAFGFLVHALWLHGDYALVPNLMRTEADAQKYFGWMLLAHLILSVAFVWIYLQGRREGPWVGQGLRYGLAIALVSSVPMFLIYYAVSPYPGLLVAKQIIGDGASFLVLGVLVAWLNK
jgi:glucan phosphoethanolaminetransferase (alkaline phosphatase superfamily)